MGCCGDNQAEACGWPTGTIRAIIAVVAVILSFLSAVAVMIVLMIKEQYATAVGVNSGLWGVLGAIIG